MVEMVETAAILNLAGPRALVILDEIGRGTATFDGLSLAWAVLEHLHEVNCCRALFATHYHELTALAARLGELACYSMRIKEWRDDIVFLHEIVAGAADRSYGIHVARLAGLPAPVVARAEEVLSSLEKGESSSVVTRLAADLPLFAAAHRQPAAPPPPPAAGGAGACRHRSRPAQPPRGAGGSLPAEGDVVRRGGHGSRLQLPPPCLVAAILWQHMLEAAVASGVSRAPARTCTRDDHAPHSQSPGDHSPA